MNSVPVQHRGETHQDFFALLPPKLSILIPVYNVEDYLADCVNSILSQLADFTVEILLLNDCSTDGSHQVCLDLCAKHPDKIDLLGHSENAGLSAARNSLLNAARGEYVWFLDSDDYLLPGSLAKLFNILRNEAPDLVLCDYQKRRFLKKKSFPGRGGKLQYSQSELIAGAFRYRKMYSWNRISLRSLWSDDLRFPVGKAFEDIATTPQLLLRAKSYYYASQSWVFYRTRPNSIMTSVSRTRGFFDARKHDDMAGGMSNIKILLRENLKPTSAKAEFYASHFIAKEFVKLASRFQNAQNRPTSSCGSMPARLGTYLQKMQESSPLNFEELLSCYLKTARFLSFFALRRAIILARVDDLNVE